MAHREGPRRRCAAAWVCAAIVFTGTTYAQGPAGPLTLERVLDLAEARSESIAIARTALQRADAERIRARSALLPQLSASAGYDRALASEFSGIFDGGGGPSCAPFRLTPAAPIGDRVAEIERAIDCGAVASSLFGGGGGADGGDANPLPFGRENTWRIGLSFSQSLFSGGRVGAQTALAAAARDAAELGLTSARAQALFEITQAYYDAALSERLSAIAEATLRQSDATLQVTETGFKAGTQPEFEVLRARVSRDNQRPALIRQQVNREVALLRLKQLLDLPPSAEIRLADLLMEDALPPPPVFATRVASLEATLAAADAVRVMLQADTPLPDRLAIREADVVVRQREAALRTTEAQTMPSVSLTSQYGNVAYPSGFFPFTSWRTNWTVGVSAQVPILTGGRQRGDELAARADVEQARLSRQQVQELGAVDTRAAWAELIAARATWEASAGTVQQASRAYEIADVRYRAGVSTQLELSDARLQLQQADANRAQAARDLQVARARVALLPELPIATGRPTGGAQPQIVVPVAPLPSQPQGGGQFRSAVANNGGAQGGGLQ